MPEARCTRVVNSRALTENDFSSHDRLKGLYITNFRGCDREKVVADEDHVGEMMNTAKSRSIRKIFSFVGHR